MRTRRVQSRHDANQYRLVRLTRKRTSVSTIFQQVVRVIAMLCRVWRRVAGDRGHARHAGLRRRSPSSSILILILILM